MNLFPIVWLTGNCGSGKTTLARAIERYWNEEADACHPLARRIIVLDGDDLRETISREEGFTFADRRTHNLRVARLARLLQSQGFLPLVAVIAPFASVRAEIDALAAPRWVYLLREGPSDPHRPYEPPSSPSLTLHTGALPFATVREILDAWLEDIISPSLLGKISRSSL